MKKIILAIVCILALNTTAQVSDSRVDTYWQNRVVPVKQYRDSTWASFVNIYQSGSPWSTIGNSISTNTNFIGTTTNRSLLFNTNGTTRMKIDSIGFISIGKNEADVTIGGINYPTMFSIHQSTNAAAAQEFHNFSNAVGGGAIFYGSRSRGSSSSPSVVVNGDNILDQYALGHDGTDYAIATGIEHEVDGTVSANIVPGRIKFSTANSSGVLTERMRISSDGKTTITSTNNVIGNTTLNSASTVTTTMPATSGTLANLSDAVFNVINSSVNFNPGDGFFYYYGTPQTNNTGFLQGGARVYLPYNCTLVSWNSINYVNGTLGSAETATVSILANGTTATTLTTNSLFTLDKSNFSNASGLNVNFNAGDYIETRVLMPSFSTNPTTVSMSAVYWFIRRP